MSARNKQVFLAVMNGDTYATAGQHFGITANRARQIVMDVRVKIMRFRRSNMTPLGVATHRSTGDMRKEREFWVEWVERLYPAGAGE